MTMAQCVRTVTAFAAMIALCATAALAVDGLNIPTKYSGSLVASQNNATGYGNGYTGSQSNVMVPGSELDAMYVTWDDNNIWIGITGNLPDKLASGQSIIILLEAADDPSGSSTLTTAGLPGDGGGYYALRDLNGLKLDSSFAPQYAVVVNRAVNNTPDSKTYANAWYMPTNFDYDWFDDLVSLDPNNGEYMSAYMDVSNLAGVDDNAANDPQSAAAATAVKGLRLRLDRAFFGGVVGQIKVMALLATSGGWLSNQVLPPIPFGEGPTGCYGPIPTPENPNTWPDFSVITGNQYATIDMSGAAPGAPSAYDGANIPTQWPANTLRATQVLHTCFGNAHLGTITYTVPGSELDQMFVRTDGTWLYLGITGNLEANGNKVTIFIDADPNAGENILDYNSPNPPPDPNNVDPIYNWYGRSFDADFAPEHCYMVNNWQGTLYADHYWLTTDTKDWLGGVLVGGGGVLSGTGANNPGQDEFALDNSNIAGVTGGNPGAPGDPSTAKTGLETRISLSELGITAQGCISVKILAILGNGNGMWLSNQFLPSLGAMTANINSDRTGQNPGPPAFKFDGTDTRFTFPAPRFVDAQLQRLGDVYVDPNCCVNANDLNVFVQVLLGLNTDSRAVSLSDMNMDGNADGLDIQLFVDVMINEGACP